MTQRWLCLLIILVIVAPGCSRQGPEYQSWGTAEYGSAGLKGLKVWVSTDQVDEARAIARGVTDKYGGTYDEVTVLVYSEGDEGNPGYWPPGVGQARHSFTCSKDGSIRQDF